MSNPWNEIDLSDYENHMSLSSVGQLQSLNRFMAKQFESYPVKTAMVLGVAGGNGLEHVRKEKYQTVYGVDINEQYLKSVQERYGNKLDVLKCLKIDILNEADRLPEAELVIANLFVEYVGYDAFVKAIKKIVPEYVSVVIQINTDVNAWVSDSPYIHAFDGLDQVHCQMEEEALSVCLKNAGFEKILKEQDDLPNGKALVRLDYRKTGK